MGHKVSLITTQLCHCGTKTAIDSMSMNEHGYFAIKLYL